MEIVKCAQCGKGFSVKPSKVKANNFCSRTCLFERRARNQISTTCERCGKPVKKPPSKASDRTFCSRQCHMQALNAELNPVRMTRDVRAKIRQAHLGTRAAKTYQKTYGRHTHRVVAEQKLGRPLVPGEVVHHIDANRHNNTPENLMVFASQDEHAAWHAKQRRFFVDGFQGGDAE